LGQLGSRWTDFHEVLYLGIFRKSAEEIQVKYLRRIAGTLGEDLE